MGCAGTGVPNHDCVCTNGAQGVAGVEQRFTFLDAGATRLNERSDRAKRLGCHLERSTCPSGRLVEEKYYPLAAQQWTGLERVHTSRQLQQRENFRRLQVFNTKQRTSRDLDHLPSWQLVPDNPLASGCSQPPFIHSSP